MNTKSFENIINEAWNNKGQVNSKSSRILLNAISKTIDLLDVGKIRVAEKKNNEWTVNQWIKKAYLISFRVIRFGKNTCRRKKRQSMAC